MAFLSRVSPLGTEVGLQVLLAVGTSSVVVRFANVAVGVALPVYQSIKALEERRQQNQRKWLGYWSVYGCLHATEAACHALLPLIPFYNHFRLGFLVWLQWPPDYGFVKVYRRVLQPLFHQYHRGLDPVLQAAGHHLAAFERAHKSEFQAVGNAVKTVACFLVSMVRHGIDAVTRHSSLPEEAQTPSPFVNGEQEQQEGGSLAALTGAQESRHTDRSDRHGSQPHAPRDVDPNSEDAGSQEQPGWVHIPFQSGAPGGAPPL